VPRKTTDKEDLRTRLAELSGWQSATRDAAQVAEEMYETRALDRVYPLSTAGFIDELFHYIREIGVWPLLEGPDSQDRKGALYPFVQFVLMTIMRCTRARRSVVEDICGRRLKQNCDAIELSFRTCCAALTAASMSAVLASAASASTCWLDGLSVGA